MPVSFSPPFYLKRIADFAQAIGMVIALLAVGMNAQVFAETGDEPLVEKTLGQLSDSSLGVLGQKAMSLRSNEWKHSETGHFIYHYFTATMAHAVSVEAEFYYRVIAKELEKDTAQWERKCHIFIFDQPADWEQFQQVGGLEKWTGGIHSQGQLFILRNPQYKFKGNSLAHEVTHLVVHRFFGGEIPLWLDEGLAEYTASRWYASFMKMRGYAAHPRSVSVGPDDYVAVDKLTSLLAYPQGDQQVAAFYAESERLVRFLSAADKPGFLKFLEAMSKGNRFDTALDKAYGSKFYNVAAMEKDFKPYAMKDYVENPG